MKHFISLQHFSVTGHLNSVRSVRDLSVVHVTLTTTPRYSNTTRTCVGIVLMMLYYCVCVSYECGDYVLNDNHAEDIQALRGCLKSIATDGQLTSSSVKSRNKQLLRSCSVVAVGKGYFTAHSSVSVCEKPCVYQACTVLD